MFDATEPTPARWANTGGIVTVHLVPAGTELLEEGDLDAEGFPPARHFQVTTPECGLGIYHGAWTHIPELVPPLKKCGYCFPDPRPYRFANGHDGFDG